MKVLEADLPRDMVPDARICTKLNGQTSWRKSLRKRCDQAHATRLCGDMIAHLVHLRLVGVAWRLIKQKHPSDLAFARVFSRM